jgi:hypothetical protein
MCVVFFFIFVCLRPLSCVTNVAGVSGLPLWFSLSFFLNKFAGILAVKTFDIDIISASTVVGWLFVTYLPLGVKQPANHWHQGNLLLIIYSLKDIIFFNLISPRGNAGIYEQDTILRDTTDLKWMFAGCVGRIKHTQRTERKWMLRVWGIPPSL